MSPFSLLLLLPTLVALAVSAKPTIHLCGDSTIAINNAHGSHGWGIPFTHYINPSSYQILNHGIPGTSSRSYTVEGHFAYVASLIRPGDNSIVIIEFGINDAGSLRGKSGDNLRSPCPGEGIEICDTPRQSGVLTYSAYLRNAIHAFRAKGARVIVSGPIPRNVYGSGVYQFEESRFTKFARNLVVGLGEDVGFVNHEAYVADAFQRLGKARVLGFYAKGDNVHPNNFGAEEIAKAFVMGLVCTNSWLARDLVDLSTLGQRQCI